MEKKKIKKMKGKKFDLVLIKYIEESKPERIPLSVLADLMEQTRGSKYKKEYRELYVHTMISRISKRNKWYELYYDPKRKEYTYEKKDSYENIPLEIKVEIEEDLDSLPVEYYPTGKKHSKQSTSIITTKTTTTTTTTTTETTIEKQEVVPVSEEEKSNVKIEISYAGYINVNMFSLEEDKMINDLDEIIFPKMEKPSENNIIKKISSILSVKVGYYKVYYNVINVDTVSNIQWLYDTLFKGSKKCAYIVYGSKYSMLGIIKSLTNNGLNILSLDEFCDGVYSPVANKKNYTAFMLHARSKWICQAVNDYVKSLSLLDQKKEPEIDIDEIKKKAKEEAKREIIASITNF